MKKKWFRGFVALVITALMVTSAVLPAGAATAKASTGAASALTLSLSTSSAYKINLTDSFKLTAKITGGKANYTYKFGYKKDGVTKYVSTKTSSSVKYTYTYKFTEAGSYVPVVKVTDAAKTTVTKKLSTVTVKNFKIKLSQTSSSKILLSEKFSTAATVSGGKSVYHYRHGYIKDGKKTFFGTSTTGKTEVYYTYKFKEIGVYTPIVEVTDADGVKATDTLGVDVIVKDFSVSFGKTSPNYLNTGNGFGTTASVQGGIGEYTYKYGYTKDGKKTYVATKKTSSPYMYYTYKFNSDGAYTPFIEVTDGDGVVAKSSLADNVTVKDFQTSFGKVSDPKINVNVNTYKAFSTTCWVSGGKGPYKFKYGYTKDGKSTVVETVEINAPYSYYTYNFPETGSYVPFVEAVDADGVRAARNNLSETVYVKDIKASLSRLSSGNTVSVNANFQTAASVSGGRASYTYKFGYVKDGKTTYVTTGSTGAPYLTYNFNFSEAGTYLPFVEVYDADGVKTARASLSEAVTVKDYKASITTTCPEKIGIDQEVATSVKVTGGCPSYTYKYGYTHNGQTTYTHTGKTGAPVSSYKFKLPEAGEYSLFVEVTDYRGTTTKSALSDTIKVKDMHVDFTTTSPYEINVAETFYASALVTGGRSNYSFRFGYIYKGYTSFQYTYTTGAPANSYKIKFPFADKFTPVIEVTDGEGYQVLCKFDDVTVTSTESKSITDCAVTLTNGEIYEESGKKIQITDTVTNRVLVEDFDYIIESVRYQDPSGNISTCDKDGIKKPGKYFATIKGLYQYYDTYEFGPLEIKNYSVPASYWSVTVSETNGSYDNNHFRKNVIVRGKLRDDEKEHIIPKEYYAVTYTDNITLSGGKKGYRINVNLTNGYSSSTVTRNVEYTDSHNLTSSNVELRFILNEGTNGVFMTYDGRMLTANSVRVYYNQDSSHQYLLKKDEDYTIDYIYDTDYRGINTGTYHVKITGIGVYSGTVTSETKNCAAEDSVTFAWGKDTLPFYNSDWFDNELRVDINQFSDEGLKRLQNAAKILHECLDISNDRLNEVIEEIRTVDKTGGFCRGMTYAVAMKKSGLIHDACGLKLDDYLKECVVIFFYLYDECQVYCGGEEFDLLQIDNYKEALYIADTLKEEPFVEICFLLPKFSGHSVLAYGTEDCNYVSPMTEKTYNHRILICDSNYSASNMLSDRCCIYFDDDGNWILPAYNEYYNGSGDSAGLLTIMTTFNNK